MAVPPFDDFLFPTLTLLSDGVERSISELAEGVAKLLGLSEQDRAELVASGIRTKYRDRVGWSRTYLNKAALIFSVRRGYWQINGTGRNFLRDHASGFGVVALRECAGFLEFINPARDGLATPPADTPSDTVLSPKESLEKSYAILRVGLESDVLTRLRTCTPGFFERLVIDVLKAMGYGGARDDSARVTGKSGDEGIDGVINEDRLGLDSVYVQAKKWENVVGRPEVHRFVGALIGQGAKKGIFITTSRFSAEAIEFAKRSDTRVVLIDGKALAHYMAEFNVGVTLVETYQIKRIDNDYFDDE